MNDARIQLGLFEREAVLCCLVRIQSLGLVCEDGLESRAATDRRLVSQEQGRRSMSDWSGKKVLVVTDAGMPTISDPGFRLMRDAIAENIPTVVIPGPSAPTMAIALSGLPTDRFTFEGFAPRAQGARRAFYEKLRFEERTMVIFEAPHRLLESLEDAASIFGVDRSAAICREMTKTYEETIRGTLSELISWASNREILGEITLVLAGVEVGSEVKTAEDAVSRVREYEAAGMDRKGAIATVAEEFGIPKKIVYAAVVDANKMSR